ncbi:MAG: type II toxin-antitoxin system death-on-curing family toxin [Deltaproteobacteria bacterium]|nr:type II toxin-antitoxin system death-on-curing family toxin [Deltaproteobacteria bacterium]
MRPEFLTVEDVIEIHESQLERFGGSDGLRDRGLLESAVAQPQMTFGGEFVHVDLFAMGAAYLFHLVANHAFVDGNKRVGLLAALVFLDINGIRIERDSELLLELTLAVAEGHADKHQVAGILRRASEHMSTGAADR